ncbi:sigma-54 dependent transcriptional regulator [Photobacterium sp. WH77]|uniref:Sigma-54-dependent Fis family transcriptional regulator n=1 Tax=Photobacterium arenosum TaxID=2774143 RepID=A0ABR9BQ75_9GAMM|nr:MULTISPECIES: sigma-54 dependent transcriptional regulator [Photobacterium]MBD8514384.1 sigma-54-dependent Fis family transcriptional regulator [Photobacterium arenosum]MBV7260551.1 sigma-54-dependent Fis family transcriptional regulator [Photobacterium sp. WH24]MCG2835670.1 sigma-54 dependent transcriptional regulator [Photobacterium sp. WH77]MCG2843283.1 sigma-54 dependent transcriptional regulator [Photobacterium sp. WH80]MDO6580846.1 sigma-54 dependent transcriptional regulator [Photoba
MTISDNIEVLIIDDDQDVADAYQHLLEVAGYQTRTATDPLQALTLLHKEWPGVVITDMYMPGMNGKEVLHRIKSLDSTLPVILITGHGDIPMAVDALQNGAADFLQKPLQPAELITLLDKHLPKRKQLIEHRKRLRQTASDVLLGDSPLIVKLRHQIAAAENNDKDALIEGEAGTGRHTLARLLHAHTKMGKGPFIKLCGNKVQRTSDLQRAMLNAREGSLCISNLPAMPTDAQHWLCRFLLEQERLAKREVRVLALVEGTAEQAVEKETLVPELFYFLSQARFVIPPLRQRASDITLLFRYFLEASCQKLNKPVPVVDKAYINTLNRHTWEGNVLELRNVAELYAIGIVKLTGQERTKSLDQMSSPLDDLIDDYEKQVIEDALYLFGGRINEVSTYLQIPRKKLYLRMKKHNLDKADYKAG